MRIEGEHQPAALVAPSTPDRVRRTAGFLGPAFPELLVGASRRLDSSEAVASSEVLPVQGPVRMVRSGDTLSQMVEALLRESGVQVSPRVIYRAVADVASSNRLADPDRIRPGQRIDFSAAVLSASAKERFGDGPDPRGVTDSTASVTRIGQRLRAFFDAMAGRFTSAFGSRTHPVTGARQFHAGVDIGLPAGTFIYPPFSGRVIFSGLTRGYGNLIILAHVDGFTTSYGHNAANLIPVGTMVDEEVPIAIVGATGTATGPHLHFEVRKDGHPVDPEALMVTDAHQHARADQERL